MEERTNAYLICKRGLYYMPNSCGYTGIRDLAGRYSLEDVSLEYPNRDSAVQDGVEFVHEDDAPEFSPKCWDDLKVNHLQGKLARLRAIIDDLTATYPLTLSEAQARVDAARKMMRGL